MSGGTFISEARGWTQQDASYTVDRSGMGTLLVMLEADGKNIEYPFVYADPPDTEEFDSAFDWVRAETYQWRSRGGKTFVTATYMGTDPNAPDMADESIDVGTSLEDIQTHPDFREKILTGDTEDVLLGSEAFLRYKDSGGMLSKTTGQWDGFSIFKGAIPADNTAWAALTDDDINPYAGMRSYYCPTVTATVSQAVNNISPGDLIAIGQINPPPIDWLPDPSVWLDQVTGGGATGRTWLNTGMKIRSVCKGVGGMVQSRTWLLSGYRGWVSGDDEFPYKVTDS